MDKSVETLILNHHVCNDESFTVLDLSSFANLKTLEVGDYSFAYVNDVMITGFKELVKVAIGNHCFTMGEEEEEDETEHHFTVKDCERLKELRIGFDSFIICSLCEVENDPSLKMIEIGDLREGMPSFGRASLKLKSEWEGMRVMSRFVVLRDCVDWCRLIL